MRRPGVLVALATLVVVIGMALVVTVIFDDGHHHADAIALISADDLERASLVDPAEWTAFVDLKKEQSSLAKRIASLDKSVKTLKPEKTKVIVQVAPPGLPVLLEHVAIRVLKAPPALLVA